MSSTFDAAIEYVLENEGGFSDNAVDHGGPTKYGITESDAARHGLDVHDLTVEQAKAIYRTDYWRFDGIGDQRVATKLFDMCVNMGGPFGRGAAIKIVQKAVGVPVDGVYGNVTMNAINNAGPALLQKLVTGAIRRYARIVADDHTQAEFIVDWIDRALLVPM